MNHIKLSKVKFKESAKRFFRNTTQLVLGVSSETDRFKTLFEVIWEDIKTGLDYGYDVKFNTNEGDIYAVSLANSYKNYFNKSGTDHEMSLIYEALTTELLPIYISKYDKKNQLELVTGEDTYGKYFEVKFKDN